MPGGRHEPPNSSNQSPQRYVSHEETIMSLGLTVRAAPVTNSPTHPPPPPPNNHNVTSLEKGWGEEKARLAVGSHNVQENNAGIKRHRHYKAVREVGQKWCASEIANASAMPPGL